MLKLLTRSILGLGLALALATCTTPPAILPATAAPPVNTVETEVAPDAVADTLLTDVRALDSTIVVDLRYATSNNFTGSPLPGYLANRAFLRREAAAALARVERGLRAQGFGIKVFDAYRPVRATLAMVDWTERVNRTDLLKDGYIASRSRHNLGLAIDLTLIDLATGRELDMGTPFDTFSSAAHTANASGQVAANRQKLKAAMEKEGFVNYDQEWWHFSFNVPNPLRFDRVIR
jgi:D-alanyl-D-alanine dipeptidase